MIEELTEGQRQALKLFDDEPCVEREKIDSRTLGALIRRKLVAIKTEDGVLFAKLTKDGLRLASELASQNGASDEVENPEQERGLDHAGPVATEAGREWLDELPGRAGTRGSGLVEPEFLREGRGRWAEVFRGSRGTIFGRRKRMADAWPDYRFAVRKMERDQFRIYGRYVGKGKA